MHSYLGKQSGCILKLTMSKMGLTWGKAST
jgi:hypothetical protein